MTPQERIKAEEAGEILIEKYFETVLPLKWRDAITCAIICVDEILKHLIDTFVPNSAAIMAKDDKDICYWQAVKDYLTKQ